MKSGAIRFSPISKFARESAPVLVPALVFFVIVLAMNWKLFVTPLIDDGDIAVNSIQVQNAKHIHELLGNYSRWHFHHPGPFLFYMFGAGEAIFYNWLHIVPAPLNAECLAEITFSTACLFLAIYIFYVHIRKPLFPVLAVFVSVLFIYAVDTAIPGSALVSVWPPYAAMFCFLLLASACASVAAGKWTHISLLAFSGMVMIHAHAAQLLFVVVLTGSALLIAFIGEVRQGKAATILPTYKYHFLAALAIVALFAAPIVIDWAVHHPNNIDHIRAYLHAYHGQHNSLSTTLLFTFSFLAFFTQPETVLAGPAAALKDLINPESFVKLYWVIYLDLLCFAIFAYFRDRIGQSPFIRAVVGEIALIFVLFTYWAWRITGPMYSMNGYFFFSVQLLGLFAVSAVIASAIDFEIGKVAQIAFACALAVPMVFVKGVRANYPSNPAIPVVVSALTNNHVKDGVLIMPMSETTWPAAAGVARGMQRSGIGFCLASEWDFMFGAAHICKNTANDYRLSFSVNPPVCKAPCSVLYSDSRLTVTGAPAHALLKFPVLITANDSIHEYSGFNAIEGGSSWTLQEGQVKFYLAAETKPSPTYVLEITGATLPGRPVAVKVNHLQVGVINVTGRTTQTFLVPESQIVWNGPNVISFDVANAGPWDKDDRILGYFFESLLLRAYGPANLQGGKQEQSQLSRHH